MSEDDLIRLHHMLDAAREAVSFIQGCDREELGTNRQLVLALVKEIEIVGEAANRVSEQTRAGLPAIPWPRIIGMRHRLVHAYFDVNLDVVWNTVRQELPGLIDQLERAIPDQSELIR